MHSVFEQIIIELTNRARWDPAAEARRLKVGLNDGLAAGEITSAARQPLAPNADLRDAARKHTGWMLDKDVFSHTGAGGSTAAGRARAEGYDWRTVGENLAWRGAAGSVGPLDAAATALHDQLFRSAGHRANLMAEPFEEIGVGLSRGGFRAGGRSYDAAMVTENLGAREGRAFLTGVAIADRDGDRFYDAGEALGGVTITARGAAGAFTTRTAAAGGYGLALPPGDYAVTAAGGGVGARAEVRLTIGADNVKLDLLAGPTARAQVFGARFAETVVGGAGDDTLRGGAGADRLTGGAGRDLLDGGTGDDALAGGAGDDRLIGAAGRDRLDGGTGNDALAGGAGDDRLVGGAGRDSLSGGVGADVFAFTRGSGVDRVADFEPGVDRLDFSAHASVDAIADLRFQRSGADVSVSDGAGGGVVIEDATVAEIRAGLFLF